MTALALDHLVFGVPDLVTGVAAFAERTGVQPVPGGRHVGRGTANYLVGLGDHRYLEIIGPDPDQPEPPGPRPFGVDELTEARLLTWCARPDDLDRCVAQARARGYDPGEPAAMSRRTPDGTVLNWRLTPDTVADGGIVPFLIDWGASEHPTARALPQLQLASLTAEHPRPAAVIGALRALGSTLAVAAGPTPRLTMQLR